MSKTHERLGIGIDFGTSNSVAAVYDGTAVHIVDFGDGKRSLPSAHYLDANYVSTTGQDALDLYIDDNIGRRVELVSVPLGHARTSTGSYDTETGLPQLAQSNVIFSAPMFDVNLPGRLFYGSKQLLTAPDGTTLPVFDRSFRLEAIVTPILLRIREGIEAQLQHMRVTGDPDHAVVGRPVHYERSGEGGDERAVRRMHTACANAGFTDHQLCFEPVAAAVNYLHSHREQGGGTLLTVDFGGGTLDFCLFTGGSQGFTVLGTHGIALGGNHIDQLLFRKLLFPLLGEGVSGRFFTADGFVETRFNFSEYAEQLLNWPVSYMLNQNRYLTPIREMIRGGGEHAGKFQRLYDLIQMNYSYLVLQHIKDFKERFATQESATLDIPELDITLTLDRAAFAAAIAPAIAQFREALDETLRLSEIAPGKIDRVICVGGSTRLPDVRAALENQFPGRVEDHEIFTSVAAGLAIRDFERRKGAHG
ncbi:MAG TPA: Hsp70 family protein [Pseudomonadales bacterium]